MKKIVVYLIFLLAGTTMKNQSGSETATFAGGCFWCMEGDFEKKFHLQPNQVVSGYMSVNNRAQPNPTYKNYAQRGYIEVIQITFDPTNISYQQLLDLFWRSIDPTDKNGQFADRGKQYRSAIFYHTAEQKKLAEISKKKLKDSGQFSKEIVTEILPATIFYPAENYHQNYYIAHPWRYSFYRSRSGRDTFLQKAWANKPIQPNKIYDPTTFVKPSDAQLQQELTPLQYNVTQKNGTEPAFDNAYWDNTRPGIYVDIVSGEPLFSSRDKFKSGTGWPSFTKPLEPHNIAEKEDRGWFTTRTEVRSKLGDSHLGHVFDDGPAPTGKRYCLNSAALKFIPEDKLEDLGYGKYKES